MNDKKNLVALFQGRKILIVGDVMIDSYYLGRVDRISPEAPVPVVVLKNTEHRLGGAANVALNISALGGEAILCSVIGGDETGELFQQTMLRNKLDSSGLLISSNRKTTKKSRFFSSGQQLLRLDEEDTHALSKEEEDNLIDKINSLLSVHDVDVILFQDYNKGVLTKRLIAALIKSAKQHGILTVVDPKSQHFFEYQGVTLFKPNLKEIAEAMGHKIKGSKDGLDGVVSELMERLSCSKVLVTLSEKGIYAKDETGSFLMPTTTQSVADVSGAGDTVISVVALGLAAGLSLQDVVALANEAAGIVCAQLGVVPIKYSDLAKKS